MYIKTVFVCNTDQLSMFENGTNCLSWRAKFGQTF